MRNENSESRKLGKRDVDDRTVPSQKKDSTTELPMYDLQDAINFASGIHEKALETAPMSDVAKQMGYKNPTSTPFYRRLTAARLFGLINNVKAELSAKARDYLRPDREDARSLVLADAVLGIRLYAEELQKNAGKKLNLHYVANSFARSLNLTEACAGVCAKAFESSIKLAGCLSADGLVALPTTPPKSEQREEQENQVEPQLPEPTPHGLDSEGQSHTLFLDGSKRRKFSINAPLVVSTGEIERIKKWLEVTLIIQDSEQLELPVSQQ